MTRECFLRLPAVVQATGLSSRTIYRMIGNGEFPAQVQLRKNIVAWRQSDVEAWIAKPTDWPNAA